MVDWWRVKKIVFMSLLKAISAQLNANNFVKDLNSDHQ